MLDEAGLEEVITKHADIVWLVTSMDAAGSPLDVSIAVGEAISTTTTDP
jgi:hypothetical protein